MANIPANYCKQVICKVFSMNKLLFCALDSGCLVRQRPNAISIKFIKIIIN